MTMNLSPRFRGRLGRWALHIEIGVRRALGPILKGLELRDGIFGLGFAVAWYGGYHISKAWSFVAAGLLMMLVALIVMKSPTEDE
jgi:hypothetical protein